ncbi:MAG: glycosyltransferase [Rhizomicrobium sp.]
MAAPAADRGMVPATRVHVLLMIPTLAGGGAERVFVTLARLLDRRLFQVSLAVFDLTGEQFRGDVPADVNLIVLNSPKVRFGLAAAVKVIRKLSPDLVVSTLNHLNIALAVTRPLWPRHVRFIARPAIALSAELRLRAHPAVWRAMLRMSARWTDLFILQSREMEEDLLSVTRLGRNRTRVIANPLDTARVRELASRGARAGGRPDAGCKLVAAGRLDEQKGFDLLLDAVARLAKTTPLSLTILGEGPWRSVLQKQIERLGLRNAVSLPGHLVNPYAVFAQSDLFVLSSRYEGFPNVVIEALACGTPVAATPLPGLAPLLDKIPGCRIARAISADALADAIAGALAEPRPKISDAALAAFDGCRSVQAYERTFLEVVEAG